jgi:hypothetical protein
MFRKLLVIVLVLVCATASFAQFRNTSPVGSTQDYLRGNSILNLKGFRGILDPSRMHMSNSLSMGYYNMGGTSVSRGLYMNTIDYQISRPLSITTHLGYQFQPSGPAEWNPANNGTQFVGGADLNWRPTENSLFRFSVYRGIQPEGSSYYDYGWGPYGYRPLDLRP